MEWLQDNFMAPLVASLIGWFWYDKKQRDSKMIQLETRIADNEKRIVVQEGSIKVLDEKMDGLTALAISQHANLERTLDRMEQRIERIK
tara:strand:+ start:751 stop:1017 length:267 start_codon:yes stop_codon:yes gene_type:complete